MRGRWTLTLLALMTLTPSAWADGDAYAEWEDPPVTAEAVEEARDATLDSEAYHFCHQEDFPLTGQEALWCPTVGEDLERCPAWKEACEAKARWEAEGGAGAGAAGGPGGRRWGRRAGGDGRSQSAPRATSGGGLNLGAGPFWVVLIIFGVVAIVMILRSVQWGGRDEDEEDAATGVVGEHLLEEGAAATISERDATRLLALAKEAAAEGRYLDAVQLCHMALLLRLDSGGLIRLHPSRTHGDYLADLRRHPSTRAEVRSIFRDVEPIFFGGREATREHFERVSSRAAAVLRELSTVLTALLCLGVLGCGETPSNTYSPYGPSGHQALIDMSERLGWSLSWREAALEGMEGNNTGPESFRDPRTPPLMLLGDFYPTAEEWSSIMAWAGVGYPLLIAADGVPTSNLGVVSVSVTEDPGTIEPVRIDHAELSEVAAGAEVVVPFSRRLEITAEDTEVLLSVRGEPYAVRVSTVGGELSDSGYPHQIVVMADDQLLTNAGLATADNARLAAALIEHLGTHAELVDGLFGAEADTAAQKLHTVGMTPVLLQLLLLAIVFLLWRGVHFGRPRESIDRTRRDFGDHVRALGAGYARCKAEDHALSVYGAWLLTQLRGRGVSGAGADITAVAAKAADQTTMGAGEIEALLTQATTDDATGGGLSKLRRLSSLHHELRRTQ